MNENENKSNGINEEESPAVTPAEETPCFSFGFPKPPVTPSFREEPEEEVSSAAEEEKTEEPAAPAQVFNPYAAPRSTEAPFGTTYHYTSANMPHSEEPAPSQPAHTTYQPQQSYSFGSQPSYQPMPEMPPKKKGKGKIIAVLIIVLCLVIGAAVMLISLKDGANDSFPSNTEVSGDVAAPTTADSVYATTQPGAIDQYNSVIVAEKARPSVVGVMTYSQGQLAGEGSGVLWKEEGGYTYIITCAHVINEKGVTYGIMVIDGSSYKTYEAELVAADTRTDIGVLKVEATGLPLAEIGNSATLKIGEPIYAIGNPGGSEFFGSVTDGIVSSIDRSISSTYKMTVIQHSAAINPGNSGGALVNIAGQIVGINSSKISATDYEGMGFAVPMSIALPVAQSLMQYKYVPNRPKLGIEYASVSSYQLYSMVVSIKGLPQGSLVIAGISADSSLANTEAEVGDLIIAVNGKDMKDSSVLLDLIETGAVGDTLTLTLCRIESRTYKTKTFDVTITLVEDKGASQEEETTTAPYSGGGYYYGGASDFEDFFND
ncbi:MAG: trypsin-like peptidase domain-containing protein, partial [Clostridia bacterium]|nr:trypsin-like peptidase domain-containing protein [Clostridia bacterium]